MAPKIGSIVRHNGWRFEDNPQYPCDVYITNGQYLSNGRVSNFWYWRPILNESTLGKEECGYGDFSLAGNEYEIIITVKKKPTMNLELGQLVYHKDIYNGREQMKIIGIRKDHVELEGDYSGGTHNVCQSDWETIEGIMLERGESIG